MSDTSKYLRRRDLVLFTVSAIVLLDTLALSAAIGASSIVWWIFLGIVFMLPIGLITAELGTTYPTDGGIYYWIQKAFGRDWAARAVWAYWVNTAIWLPAIFILFAGVSNQLFGLNLPLGGQIGIGIALAWLTVGLEVVGLKIGKWVPNMGAILKLIIFSVLIFGGVMFARNHGIANDLSGSNLVPGLKEGLEFLPVIIYGMLGFELVSSAGDEIVDPGRNVPKAILISGVLILLLYLFATVGILVAIPIDEIDIVEGLIDTLKMFFSDVPGGGAIVTILGVGALYTFFSNGATWAMGCNRATAEAAADGELPKMFAWRHPQHGGAIGASILMGAVCSLALIVYGFLATSNEDLFWNLFKFSAVIFMLPYLGMVLSFARLRFVDPEARRPFKVAGGNRVAILLAGICAFILLMTIWLFMYVPGEGLSKPTIIGFIVAMAAGELLIRYARYANPNS